MGSTLPVTLKRRSTIRKWALLALAFTLIRLLNFCIAMIGALAGQSNLPWKYPLIGELLDAYARNPKQNEIMASDLYHERATGRVVLYF